MQGSNGSEVTMRNTGNTTVNMDGPVIRGRNTPVTTYQPDVTISDRTGYAQSGTQTEVTLHNQYSNMSASQWGKATLKNALPDGRGLALGFLSDILAAIKNPILKDQIEKFKESLEIEDQIKEAIQVYENNI